MPTQYLDEGRKIRDILKEGNRVLELIKKISDRELALLDSLNKDVKRIQSLKRPGMLTFWEKKDFDQDFEELATKIEVTVERIRKHAGKKVEGIHANPEVWTELERKNSFCYSKRQDNVKLKTETLLSLPIFQKTNDYERHIVERVVERNDLDIKNLLRKVIAIGTDILLQKEQISTLQKEVQKRNHDDYAAAQSSVSSIRRTVKNSIMHYIDEVISSLQTYDEGIRKEVQDIQKREKAMAKVRIHPQDVVDLKKKLDVEKDFLGRKKELVLKLLKENRSLKNPMAAKQFIAVRTVDHIPTKGVLKHPAQFYNLGLASSEGPQDRNMRFTLHFTLNCIVGGYVWDFKTKRQYAIMIPLEKIMNRVICLVSIDTFVFGNLTLPKGTEVIMPRPAWTNKERQERFLRKQLGNAEPVFYEQHETLQEVVGRRIRERGYTLAVQKGMWSWTRIKDQEERKIVEQLFAVFSSTDSPYDYWDTFISELAHDVKKDSNQHSSTKWAMLENFIPKLVHWSHEIRMKDDPKHCQDAQSWLEGTEYWIEDITRTKNDSRFDEEKETCDQILKILKDFKEKVRKSCPSEVAA